MTLDEQPGAGRITRLLHDVRDGDGQAFGALLPLVYDDLKRIADRQLRRERQGHTLHATALVHEAYMKLADQARLDWQDRAHFLGIAARAMRQILIDYARRRNAEKRGGGWNRTTLAGKPFALDVDAEELIALDEALDQLDERQRQIVEFRFFGGMTEQEIAEVLGVSDRTVRREWVKARAWLYATLYPEGA